MKTTWDFLNAVKTRYGITSDYALAKKIGVSRAAVSYLKNRGDSMSDLTACRVAELLEIDPAIVLASLHAESAKSEPEKHAWKSIIEKLGGLAASVLIGIGAASAPAPSHATEASASNPMYIM